MRSQQRADFLEQRRIPSTGLAQKLLLPLGRHLQRRLQQIVDSFPAFSIHQRFHDFWGESYVGDTGKSTKASAGSRAISIIIAARCHPELGESRVRDLTTADVVNAVGGRACAACGGNVPRTCTTECTGFVRSLGALDALLRDDMGQQVRNCSTSNCTATLGAPRGRPNAKPPS